MFLICGGRRTEREDILSLRLLLVFLVNRVLLGIGGVLLLVVACVVGWVGGCDWVGSR